MHQVIKKSCRRIKCFLNKALSLQFDFDLWDEDVTRSLYSRVDNLEKTNLITAITYYQRNGMDPTPLVKRLKEIEDEEAAANAEGMATEAALTAARAS